MTDRDRDSHTPPHKKQGLTAEQVAAMSADEKDELIAELEAALVLLRAPVPQPYPKWVEINGVPMIVQSPEEEAAKIAADAAYRKAHPDHDLPGRPVRGAHPEQPIAETPEPKGGRSR